MLIAQFFGVLAFLVGVFAFLQKQDSKYRYYMVGFCLLMGVHFILMGAMTGAISAAINGVRTYLSMKYNSRKMAVLFVALQLGLALPYVEHWFEYLPVIGSAVGTWALFTTYGLRLRSMILFNSCCWVTHNILIGSIGGSIVESTFIITNLVTIIRMHKEMKGSGKEQAELPE